MCDIMIQLINGRMQLRNITNEDYPSFLGPTKHQLNNEGCKCHLCQKVVINQNKVIPHVPYVDSESELTLGRYDHFLIPFLSEFFFLDKLTRKVRFLLPEICIFEKGMPTLLISKKRESGPIRMIRNKEKLNAFQIQNFFADGYLSHNSAQEGQSLSRQQRYNRREELKNECIVLAKFANGSCQMMTLEQLNSLFKSKQRHLREEVSTISTLVNTSDHNEIRVRVDLRSEEVRALLERAKIEVRIMSEEIKQKDFLFVQERDELAFEDSLRDKDPKRYLQYISIKMLLLYSIRTDVVPENCLCKFISGPAGTYYLTDIHLYKKSPPLTLWGVAPRQNAPLPPVKERQRPTSSPDRMFNRAVIKTDENREDRSISYKLMRENERVKRMMGERMKTASTYKLQPIRVKTVSRK